MKLDCEIVSDAYGATYEPWTDGWAIGFKVTRDGRETIVCLNPSSDDDDRMSNVFLYVGTPQDGSAITWIDVFPQRKETP